MAKKSKSTTSTPNLKPRAPAPPKSAPPKASSALLNLHGDASDPAPEAATPARKRKAPQDADDDDNNNNNNNNQNDSNDADGDAASTPAAGKKPRIAIHSTQATATSSGGMRRATRHTAARVEIPVATPPAKKHIVFGDDGGEGEGEGEGEEHADAPSEFFTPQEAPARNPLEAQLSLAGTGAGTAEQDAAGDDDDGSDDDDDDEAPEAVSTSAAAAQAARSAAAATQAAEKQEEAQRHKRQERDARFRAQAEARKKQQAPAPTPTPAPTPAAAGPAVERGPRVVTSTAPTSGRRRLDRRALPSVLPEEFLASDSEGEQEEDHDRGGAGENTRIKFNTLARQVARAGEDRPPADRRVGATVYRVAKREADGALAPRGGKYSRNAREGLLRRGRTGPATVPRKRGFLVKR